MTAAAVLKAAAAAGLSGVMAAAWAMWSEYGILVELDGFTALCF